MIPLTFVNIGDTCLIEKISGTKEMKKHLNDLGFTIGDFVSVVSIASGNLILSVKDSRIAIGKELASKIQISLGGPN